MYCVNKHKHSFQEHTGDDDEGVGMASIEVTLDLVIETMSTAGEGFFPVCVYTILYSRWPLLKFGRF